MKNSTDKLKEIAKKNLKECYTGLFNKKALFWIVFLLAIVLFHVHYASAENTPCSCIGGIPGVTTSIPSCNNPVDVVLPNANDCSVNSPSCSCRSPNTCADEYLDTLEQCDNTATPSFHIGDSCQMHGFTGGTLLCAVNCFTDFSQCNNYRCGNSNIDPGEDCDMGDQNGAVCDPSNAACNYCSSECKNVYLKQNINGWHSDDNTWTITENKTLETISTDTSIYTSDDHLISIKADTYYNLSFNIFNPTSCTVSVRLMGDCLSAQGNIQKHCFNDVITTPQSATQWVSSSTLFNIPSDNNALQGYFRNLKINIRVVDCTANTGVQFDDISLREIKYSLDGAHYDTNPSVNSATGCCPASWCWNGDECVKSGAWMNNSGQPPIWNVIFNDSIHNWTNGHVMSNEQQIARGYRCVLDDKDNAYWKLSEVKYDWNYAQSGYCNAESDCFVAREYHNDQNNGSGCIKNGETISDKQSGSWTLNSGNHYCLNGTWTSESYLLAKALQSITTESNYILFCDNRSNTLNDPQAYISSVCTMVVQNSQSSEQIIAALSINSATHNANFLKYINDKNQLTFPEDAEISPDIASCQSLNDYFVDCAPSSQNIFVYYNTKSNYFLVSTSRINIINPTAWDNILGFFKKIFGITSKTNYESLNYISNFDRIYLSNNNAIKIRGFEEVKYDENNQSNRTFMYINYSGVANKINIPYIQSKAISVDYNVTGTDQILIVKSAKSIGVWEYLTGMLRDR